MAIHLIASGEASGNLDEMLLRAAKNQEKEENQENIIIHIKDLYKNKNILYHMFFLISNMYECCSGYIIYYSTQFCR